MAGVFELLDKLVTEHGSAAILREHVGLLKAQYAAMEAEKDRLKADLEHAQTKVLELEVQTQQLKQQLQTIRNANPKGYTCDHCGSISVTRIGARKDRTFGRLGGKQAIYRCDACGQESEFLEA